MLQPHIFGVNEKNIFKVRLEHLDIEPRRIHDLRSTGWTFASDEGTDIKSLHVQLGHNDIDTTLRHYNQSTNEILAKESRKSDVVLG